MLTLRVRNDAAQSDPLAATAIERRVRAHPLAPLLNGTVVLGCGTVSLLRPDDPRPWVIIPLALTAGPNALGRAQIAHADAVVVVDRHEASLLRPQVDTVPIVVMATQSDTSEPFLPAASHADSVAAREEMLSHPALVAALPALGVSGSRASERSALFAEAAIEALVAAGDGRPANRR